MGESGRCGSDGVTGSNGGQKCRGQGGEDACGLIHDHHASPRGWDTCRMSRDKQGVSCPATWQPGNLGTPPPTQRPHATRRTARPMARSPHVECPAPPMRSGPRMAHPECSDGPSCRCKCLDVGQRLVDDVLLHILAKRHRFQDCVVALQVRVGDVLAPEFAQLQFVHQRARSSHLLRRRHGRALSCAWEGG